MSCPELTPISGRSCVCNFQGRYLDLIFCSDIMDVETSKSNSPMVRVDEYHEPIEIEFNIVTDNAVDFNPNEHEYNSKKQIIAALMRILPR